MSAQDRLHSPATKHISRVALHSYMVITPYGATRLHVATGGTLLNAKGHPHKGGCSEEYCIEHQASMLQDCQALFYLLQQLELLDLSAGRSHSPHHQSSQSSSRSCSTRWPLGLARLQPRPEHHREYLGIHVSTSQEAAAVQLSERIASRSQGKCATLTSQLLKP